MSAASFMQLSMVAGEQNPTRRRRAPFMQLSMVAGEQNPTRRRRAQASCATMASVLSVSRMCSTKSTRRRTTARSPRATMRSTLSTSSSSMRRPPSRAGITPAHRRRLSQCPRTSCCSRVMRWSAQSCLHGRQRSRGKAWRLAPWCSTTAEDHEAAMAELAERAK
jgi:hypothetical protein